MQRKEDQMIIALTRNFEVKRDFFEQVNAQYLKHKDRLENLQFKQEAVMREIEEWSVRRKVIEK